MTEPPRVEASGEGIANALERLVFFSDAVFAIGMTLLVLNIPRPRPKMDVGTFLTTHDSKFLGFFISFWVIALFWLGHHRLSRFVRTYDQGLITLNLILLFLVAFLPFRARSSPSAATTSTRPSSTRSRSRPAAWPPPRSPGTR